MHHCRDFVSESLAMTFFRYLYDIPEGKEPTNLERQQEEVTIHNLRSVPAEARPKLRENGIQLVKFKVPSDIDWDNQEEVRICKPVQQNSPGLKISKACPCRTMSEACTSKDALL